MSFREMPSELLLGSGTLEHVRLPEVPPRVIVPVVGPPDVGLPELLNTTCGIDPDTFSCSRNPRYAADWAGHQTESGRAQFHLLLTSHDETTRLRRTLPAVGRFAIGVVTPLQAWQSAVTRRFHTAPQAELRNHLAQAKRAVDQPLADQAVWWVENNPDNTYLAANYIAALLLGEEQPSRHLRDKATSFSLGLKKHIANMRSPF